MTNKLTDNTISEFSEALASKAPTPGGGGAAALIGALGIALCNMAGNLSINPKRAGLGELNQKADALRGKLLCLIEEDAKNFEPLSKAYSKPKTAPDYAETMRKATLDACKSPLDIMRCSCEAIEIIEQTKPLCSKLLLSDLACAASACHCALESASYNVFVNTKTLSAEDAESINAEADEMLAKYLPRAQAISNEITYILRGCDNNG